MVAEQPAFRGVIEFFGTIGVYDVVLPFLLVFTIVFAILEKTKVLGMEEIEGKKYTKKNLNAIVAFVVAFLVVASTKLVAVINQVLANVVLLLLLAIFFLLLVGSFFKEEGGVFLEKGWKTLFMFIMFIGIVLIFLHALNWLGPFWNYMTKNLGTAWIGSLILLIIIIIFIVYVTKGPSPPKSTGGGV
jgi:hypothetical protein